MPEFKMKIAASFSRDNDAIRIHKQASTIDSMHFAIIHCFTAAADSAVFLRVDLNSTTHSLNVLSIHQSNNSIKLIQRSTAKKKPTPRN